VRNRTDKDASLQTYCDRVRRGGRLVVATWIEDGNFHGVLVWLPDKRRFQVECFPFFVDHWGYQTSGYSIEPYRLGSKDCKLPGDVKQKAGDFLASWMAEHGSSPITLANRETLLVLVRDGRVSKYTWEMGISDAEFVRVQVGELPAEAWVGTVSKIDGQLVLASSKHFHGYQLPVPEPVKRAVRAFLQ
jgi:hypothetical protein